MDEAMANKTAYRVPEAAKLLSIGESTARHLVATRQLKSIRIGRRLLIPSSAIDEFVQSEMKRQQEEYDDAMARCGAYKYIDPRIRAIAGGTQLCRTR